jgi:hypothetical protein
MGMTRMARLTASYELLHRRRLINFMIRQERKNNRQHQYLKS